ncbi:MAG TPA: 5-(carboxyamino)imidazole ribonucleotide synthase [Pseudogracilibacillus sp.]|nr:5-(carboxyamino)imidazole ribonucleotide synthase [Pseudogracilibacillus sp.]
MRTNNHNQVILPPQTIGIIGGGQLGRMMAIAARYNGYRIIVLDPTPNCPTAQVADEQIVATYDDMNAIEQLTEKSDVVTYEFENVDLEAARYIEAQGKLPQGAYALQVTQNREAEKTLMRELGLPVAPFYIVRTEEEVREAVKNLSFPAVIKTCLGGYDGKGQLKLESRADVEAAVQFIERGGTFIMEEWISFDKEISVVFTRAQDGTITYFPLAENEHRDHILYTTLAPAGVSQQVKQEALTAAKTLAEKINIVGTFAIEMFVKDDGIFINEMAPRPHNSGHFTIEACNVSQFSQHIRAICGLPLPNIEQQKEALMINVLGEDMNRALTAFSELPEASIHLYGKAEAKEKRKMGHVTLVAENLRELLTLIQRYEEDLL